MRFLSTLPARGATFYQVAHWLAHILISIHAPREGSDLSGPRPERQPHEFLSTLPARGATGELRQGHFLQVFLSTLPARGATPHSAAGM